MNPTTHQATADDTSPMPPSPVVLVPEELMRAYVMLMRACESALSNYHGSSYTIDLEQVDALGATMEAVGKAMQIRDGHRAAGGGK